MDKKTLKIKSHLHVCGTDEVQTDAEKDLQISDPEPEKAKAILDKALGKEDDDEEGTEEDIETVDAESRTDCAEDSESQAAE